MTLSHSDFPAPEPQPDHTSFMSPPLPSDLETPVDEPPADPEPTDVDVELLAEPDLVFEAPDFAAPPLPDLSLVTPADHADDDLYASFRPREAVTEPAVDPMDVDVVAPAESVEAPPRPEPDEHPFTPSVASHTPAPIEVDPPEIVDVLVEETTPVPDVAPTPVPTGDVVAPEVFAPPAPVAPPVDTSPAPVTSVGRPELERLLAGIVVNGCSDLHLVHGLPPRARDRGELLDMPGETALTSEEIKTLIYGVLTEAEIEEFELHNDLDTAYSMREEEGAVLSSRFRLNVLRSLGSIAAVARVIPSSIPKFEDLNLPPQLRRLSSYPRGLVVVCGPTGSAKLVHLSTIVPTPTGNTTMGALAVGDQVIGRDGKPCRVTALSPIIEKPDLYRVTFSDGQAILADYDHQWLVSTHHARNVPRTKKRQRALERYDRAHADADALDDLVSSPTLPPGATTEELHELLSAHGLTTEFPSDGAVYSALRMTDCPGHDATRAREVAGRVQRQQQARVYPVREILVAVANAPRKRSARAEAAALLASEDYPQEATARQIGAMLGRSHSTASDVAKIHGIAYRVVEFIDSYPIAETRHIPVVEYPTGVALKSLALRLRQRFSTPPATDADLARMTTGEMLAAGLNLPQGHANFAVPLTSALDLPDADLPLDPYVLGAWLGDGSKASGGMTGIDDDMWPHFEDAGYVVTHGSQAKSHYVKGLVKHLRAAGVFKDKHIPMPYLRASADQRLALLQGLMDTDGTVNKSGSCAISLSDRRLAEGTLNLIRSLGIKASVSWSQRATYRDQDGNVVECKPSHRIRFTTDQPVFRLPRKLARLPEPGTLRETQGWIYITAVEKLKDTDSDYGPGRCLTVDSPDHTFLCGDGYVVTSNSTTVASIINEINLHRPDRIITLEDPVEFVHTSQKATISHREVGVDTPSFAEGLRRVRREDPDVILVGEMRDNETVSAAMEAAETGHLVFGTLHTNSASETISNIINRFPAAAQNQVRTTLSSTLQAVVCQTLVPAPSTPRGRVVAAEIMFVDDGIRSSIRENKISAIAAALVNEEFGNMSRDKHLAKLFTEGVITRKVAISKATSEKSFNAVLGGSTQEG